MHGSAETQLLKPSPHAQPSRRGAGATTPNNARPDTGERKPDAGRVCAHWRRGGCGRGQPLTGRRSTPCDESCIHGACGPGRAQARLGPLPRWCTGAPPCLIHYWLRGTAHKMRSALSADTVVRPAGIREQNSAQVLSAIEVNVYMEREDQRARYHPSTRVPLHVHSALTPLYIVAGRIRRPISS